MTVFFDEIDSVKSHILGTKMDMKCVWKGELCVIFWCNWCYEITYFKDIDESEIYFENMNFVWLMPVHFQWNWLFKVTYLGDIDECEMCIEKCTPCRITSKITYDILGKQIPI